MKKMQKKICSLELWIKQDQHEYENIFLASFEID